MSTTWAGIVRVSHMGHRKADDADFHSERDQLNAMQEAVKKIGGTLDVLPSELGISGGLPLEQRPSLLAAVEGVEKGRYAGIVVAYQSRLGREMEQEEALWRRIEAAGGQIIMALDGLDVSTVDGKMVRRIRSAINVREREAHIERFDNLREWATKAGIWQRRQTPIGYRRDPKTRRLVPDKNATRVRGVFRRRAAGANLTQLADDISMTATGVRRLLANRVYLGELRVGKYINSKAHPPLISQDVFDAAQIPQPRPGRRKKKDVALLAGLVRCSGCGHIMARRQTKTLVYSCTGRSSAGRCPAPAGITAALIEAHVEAIALSELAIAQVSGTANKTTVSDARAELVKAESELATFLSAVSADSIGAAAFAAAALQRREAIDKARQAIHHLVALQPVVPIQADSIEEYWQELNPLERNVLLRGLIAVVVVRRAGGRGATHVPLPNRVRVIATNSGFPLPVRPGGTAMGIVSLPFPDINDPCVLRVTRSENRL